MNRYCPSCGAEYRPGFTHCSDCGVELTDTPPDPRRPSAPKGPAPLEHRADLIEVYRSNAIDAQVVSSFLESNGIATVLRQGGTGGYPVSVGGLGEGRILVVRDDAPVARELIELSARASGEADEPEDDEGYDDYEDYEPGYWVPWYRRPTLIASIALILVALLAILYGDFY